MPFFTASVYKTASFSQELLQAPHDYMLYLTGACAIILYRGKVSGNYVYWDSGQEVPAGATDIVQISVIR